MIVDPINDTRPPSPTHSTPPQSDQLKELAQKLFGQTLTMSTGVLSFDSEAQLGDLTIGNVAGRDTINYNYYFNHITQHDHGASTNTDSSKETREDFHSVQRFSPVQCHPYSGHWEVQSRFFTWRGYALRATDVVYYSGKGLLLLSDDGLRGSGMLVGKLYVNISDYEATYDVIHRIEQASVARDEALHLDLNVLSRIRVREKGIPQEERLRKPLPGSQRYPLVLFPVPESAKTFHGKHVYIVALQKYQEAEEEYTHNGF